MDRGTAAWFSAAAISLAVHCAVFGCAAWAIGAKKKYLPMEIFRYNEAPIVARNADVIPPAPKKAPEPPPRPKLTAAPQQVVQAPKPEPIPARPEPVPVEAPPPPPSIFPAPETMARIEPPASQPESVPPAPAYQEVEKLSSLPFLRTNVRPLYPRNALRSGKKSRVVAEVFINEKGGVDNILIAQSGGEEFDSAVIAALKQSQFEPGYMAGRPVAVRVRIPFNFRVG